MASGPEAFFAIFAEKGPLAVAGAFGGVVRWMTLRERIWPDGIISLATGAICAVFVSPLARPIIEPFVGTILAEGDQISNLSAFIIGVGGISVSGFIVDIWRAKRGSVSDDSKPAKK